MQASHMMSNAIAQLHGVPDAKKRRTELRHRLVDIQTRVPEDMSVFALPWDIKGVEAKVKEALGEGPLLDQLFIFRPLLHYSDYRTPLEGLYLCGAGTHPGGGVTGANGRNCAAAVVADRRRGRLRRGRSVS